MAGEVGKLEIGARINRQELQGDIQGIERDLSKVRSEGEKTTSSIERVGKAGTMAGVGLIGMATAGIAAFSNLTKGSPALVGEKTQQQIAKTQINLQGGSLMLPFEQLKTKFYKFIVGMVTQVPEKLSGLLGIGKLATGAGILGGVSKILSTIVGSLGGGKLAAGLAGFGSSTLLGTGVGLLGGIGGTALNWLTDKLGITNKNKNTSATVGRFLSQAGGGAGTGALAGLAIGSAGGPIGAGLGAIIGAIGGIISAGFQEHNIRSTSNTQNRKYQETRQEYQV